MKPRVRKFALTAHIVASVGWLGAAVAFLPLAVTGMASDDPRLVRAVYLAMEPVAQYALVPLALASLVTGLVQSLGTQWGLFRHYWVLFKLLINVVASVFLLIYTQTLSYFAGIAASRDADGLDTLRGPSALLHTGLALLLLVTATVLAVYKPRGLTAHGRRVRWETTHA